jgi:glucosamine 6-phosphate synthetase-like amidotransferase/phosphosugar isomerase protein
VVLPTLAGPAIGVASTKAFTTQPAVLAAFTIAIARARGTIGKRQLITAAYFWLGLTGGGWRCGRAGF